MRVLAPLGPTVNEISGRVRIDGCRPDELNEPFDGRFVHLAGLVCYLVADDECTVFPVAAAGVTASTSEAEEVFEVGHNGLLF